MLTRFIMEDTLRALVEESLSKFTTFILGCCAGHVLIHATNNVELLDAPVGTAGSAAGSVTPVAALPPDAAAPGRKPPLLTVELAPNKEGTKLTLSVAPEQIVSKIMNIYDAAITRVQGLPHLEPAVMENLFWATLPLLSSVHSQEAHVVSMRSRLRGVVTAALAPLSQYVALYEK